ncbi:protein of unknown function [Cupriavidus taiwanensis]|nr:protein of unknown function [Cupriavidus taiwanensis]
MGRLAMSKTRVYPLFSDNQQTL